MRGRFRAPFSFGCFGERLVITRCKCQDSKKRVFA